MFKQKPSILFIRVASCAASRVAIGAAFSALVACGAAPASDGVSSEETSQASSVGERSSLHPDTPCEDPPVACTADVVSSSLSVPGLLYVKCGSDGNGTYTLGLGTSVSGPFTLATDPSNPSGTIPYTNGDPLIQFNGVDEDNAAFPGNHQIVANHVQVCATSSNLCNAQGGLATQCVVVPVTLAAGSGSGSSSGGSSSGSSSGGSSSGSSSGGSSSGSSSGGRTPPPPPPPR